MEVARNTSAKDKNETQISSLCDKIGIVFLILFVLGVTAELICSFS